jgi:hypothetical protein
MRHMRRNTTALIISVVFLFSLAFTPVSIAAPDADELAQIKNTITTSAYDAAANKASASVTVYK